MGKAKKLFIALLCLLLAGLCACGRGEADELALYNSILRKNYISMRVWGVLYDGVKHYALYDLDGDGAKELLLGVGNGTADGTGILDVYTIRDKKAVLQDIIVWNRRSGPPLLFANGTIKFVDQEMDWISYYRFVDSELKLQIRLLDQGEYYEWFLRTQSVDPHFPPYSRVDLEEDIPLAKEEFEQLQKEMEGDGQIVELDWRPLAAYRG